MGIKLFVKSTGIVTSLGLLPLFYIFTNLRYIFKQMNDKKIDKIFGSESSLL